MTDNNNGYFFLSHSSKDIEKVRMIRNIIEHEKGNPIMFYLKCLDNDNPTGKDEEQLKDLIRREILARKKFILCKSKNTEPPLSSDWIEWEKSEVKKLQQKFEDIQVHEINIEDDGYYLQKVIDIIRRQRKILLVAPYELRGKCSMTKQYLTQYNMYVETVIEEGDIRNDLLYNFGQHTKEMVKGILNKLAQESGIVVLLDSKEIESHTIVQMAYAFGKRYNCSIISFDISIFDEKTLEQIYLNLEELIIS